MFFVLGGLILTSGLSYYYRSYIFSFALRITLVSVLNCIKLYGFIYSCFNKKNKINKIISKNIGNLKIEEYEIFLNDKKHDTILIASSSIELTEQFNELITNISNNLQNKNKIVYCNVVNQDDDIIVELTNIFRKFFYYFDKQDFKMEIFFDYVQEYLNDNNDKYNGVNIYNYNFIVYLNDDSFTELGYEIKYIKEKSIIDILTKK